jgi:hypothetical protein
MAMRRRTRRTTQNLRDGHFNEILADIYETVPVNPMSLPDLYNEDLSLEQNVADLLYQLRWSLRTDKRIEGLVTAYYLGEYLERRPLTPKQRARCRALLTKHYITCCQRIYDFFSIQGIKQIYRTKRTCFWMFRAMKKSDLVRLAREAEDMF